MAEMDKLGTWLKARPERREEFARAVNETSTRT